MSYRLLQGDVSERLAQLDSGSAQTCITSPPYFGLRDYGTGEWAGGSSSCDHVKGELRRGVNLAQSVHSTRGGAKKAAEIESITYGQECGKCGATRTDSQIGLERTPDAYVAKLVEVFREVKRVLRDDGTLWLNLGDSYAAGAGAVGDRPGGGAQGDAWKARGPATQANRMPLPGLKPKDLIGVPWRVAFALQADGWYLRSEIIWAKPNPMPESVTDRPTKAHEQVFLLSKSARYFYDAQAIAEQGQDWTRGGPGEGILTTEHYGADNGGNAGLSALAGRYKAGEQPQGRNKRSVWTVATKPYPEAHFAVYPEALILPMVLAGSPSISCGDCGAPWERRVQSEQGPDGTGRIRPPERNPDEAWTKGTTLAPHRGHRGGVVSKTTGFAPTCSHDDRTGQGVVLDPFCGSGTTLKVAVERGREAIGIELNPEYCALAERRLGGVTPPLFA